MNAASLGVVEFGPRERMAADAISADVVAARLLDFMDAAAGPFVGTLQELFLALTPARLPTAWPGSSLALGARLRRMAPVLRSAGLAIDFPDPGERTGPSARLFRIEVSLAGC